MIYCSNCGNQLPDDAYFCPKCGTKTQKGKAAQARYPSDELQAAFYQVGVELERAFTLAAKETHDAFKKVSADFQHKYAAPQQAASQSTVACPKCGTKNPSGAIFCNNCGTRIAPIEESHGSE